MLEHFSVLWSHKYQRALAGLEKKTLLPVFPSGEDEWKFCASNAKEIETWLMGEMAPSVWERGITSREVRSFVWRGFPVGCPCLWWKPVVLEGQFVSQVVCYLAGLLVGRNKGSSHRLSYLITITECFWGNWPTGPWQQPRQSSDQEDGIFWTPQKICWCL